ncbi:MAG: SDR family oxidoreductase [Verrucomicrobia bacterium]|nr:SDR family oxidoreductase [Verrucomicrobiota bacterium]
MSLPLAWITGAGGLIGSHLVRAAATCALHWRTRGLTRAELDLTDHDAVRALFHQERPALVIHCAALSKSADCQRNPELARRVNVEATARLAELAADIPLIYFSTDLVFDGRQGNYDESAPVSPITVYGETKAAAEQLVQANPRHTVIRTSLTYGVSPSGDRAFNEELLQACRAGCAVRLFTDEIRCPIPAEVTVRAVWELASLNQPGLYHLAGSERLSRWDIGQVLATRWPELRASLEPGSLRDFRGAPRSPDTSLNCAKIQKLLTTPLPRFTEWIKAHSASRP